MTPFQALIWAVRMDQEHIQCFIDQGADVNGHERIKHETPMHWARSARMVKQLLDAGADPNARDARRRTPLSNHVNFYTFGEESQAIVRLMIQAGANPHLKDDLGLSPWDIALPDVRTFMQCVACEPLAEALDAAMGSAPPPHRRQRL